jgi:hypothetical protein
MFALLLLMTAEPLVCLSIMPYITEVCSYFVYGGGASMPVMTGPVSLLANSQSQAGMKRK